MLSTQMPSRVAMPCPFAGNGNRTEVVSESGSNVNFKDGFPSAYGAPTPSNNGKFVTRKEMNGAFYASTADTFYHKAGGLNTFDQAFAHAVGGYPYGAVLDYLEGRNLHKVVSLVDNNKIDFTGKASSFEDISSGVVDNVNWAYCNRDESISTSSVMLSGEFAVNAINHVTATSIGSFVAPFSGVITAKSGLAYNFENTSISAVTQENCITGGGILVRKVSSVSEIGDVFPFRNGMNSNEAMLWHNVGPLGVSGNYTAPSLNYPNGISNVGYASSTSSSASTSPWSVASASLKMAYTNAGDIWVVCAYVSDIVSTMSTKATGDTIYKIPKLSNPSIVSFAPFEVSVTRVGI